MPSKSQRSRRRSKSQTRSRRRSKSQTRSRRRSKSSRTYRSAAARRIELEELEKELIEVEDYSGRIELFKRCFDEFESSLKKAKQALRVATLDKGRAGLGTVAWWIAMSNGDDFYFQAAEKNLPSDLRTDQEKQLINYIKERKQKLDSEKDGIVQQYSELKTQHNLQKERLLTERDQTEIIQLCRMRRNFNATKIVGALKPTRSSLRPMQN